MSKEVPSWAEDLIGPKLQNEENIRSAQVLQESPLGKMAVTYTNERIFLTQKKTLGRSQVFELDPPSEPFTAQADKVTCPDCGDSFRTWNTDQLDSLRCFSCGTVIPLGDGEVPTESEVAEPVSEPAEVTPEPAPEPEPEPTPFTVDEYTLYKRDVDTGSGGARTMRYFAKTAPEDATAIPLPDGFEVGRNDRSGLPYLRRSDGAGATSNGTSSTVTPTAEPADPLLAVHGVGAQFAGVLAGAGIETIPELLDADAEALAEETDLSVSRIERFQSLGGLLEVKGIGPQIAQGLLDIGIQNLEDLSEVDPTDVAEVEGVSVNRARSFIQSANNKTQGHR